MKKKLVSLLLALLVIVGLIAIGVAADEATPATHSDHCVCGGKRDGRGDHTCGEALTGWTAFSLDLCEADSNANRLVVPAGNYYLSSDLTINKELIIAPDTEVTFCLSGYTLTGSRRVFRVNGTLNITDCYLNGNGKIVGNAGNASVFYGYSGGHINLYGGILTAKTGVTRNYGCVGALATDAGNAAAKGGSSMTMYGGTLDASKLTITKDDSGNQGSGGAVVLFGSGTNVCTFIQYGGTIKGAKSVAGYGSALYGNAVDTIKILGNDKSSGIVNGDCAIAGKSGCNIVVGGGAKIDDLYMLAGQTFTTENLTGSVGLSTPVSNAGVLTSCTETEAALFTSNMPDYRQLSYADGNLSFASVHEDHCVCGGAHNGVGEHACADAEGWIGLTAENINSYLTPSDTNDGGNVNYLMFADDYDTSCFYLTESITVTTPIEIHNGDNVSLCLNGYTLTYKKSSYDASLFRMWGQLNITDCTGEGTMTSNASCEGGMFYLTNTRGAGTLNIYDGNFKMTDNNSGKKSGFMQIGNNGTSDAVVNLYGGTISGGVGSSAGNIMVERSATATGRSVLNMYGGTVTGGTASTSSGGNIYVNYQGEFNMYGGTVSGGTATTTGGNLYVRGTANLCGGTIEGGAGENGGNMYVYGGTANVRGSVIQNGEASNRGGNIYVYPNVSNSVVVNQANVNVYSGSILNGQAKDRGGNIYVDRGAVTVYGGEVTGGVLTEPGYGLDIAMGAPTAGDASITLDGAVKIGEVGVYGNSSDNYAIALGDNFSTETPIKVAASTLSKVIKNVSFADLASFVPANEDTQLTYESGDIYLRSAADRYACYCGGTYEIGGDVIGHTNCSMVKWTAVTNDAVNVDKLFGEPVNYDNASLGGDYYYVPEGNYYLTEDITLDAGLRLNGGTSSDNLEVRIDLNGHTMTFSDKAPRAFFVNTDCSLRVSDSSYDASKMDKAEQFQGQVVTMTTNNYSIAYISGGGTVRIFGGKYSNGAEGKAGNSRIAMVGTMYVFDGYFQGGDGAGNGKLFELHDNTAHTIHGKISFYRATAVGGNTNNGGVLSMTMDGQGFYMYSGTLIGGTATGMGGTIYAPNGTVKISDGSVTGGEAKQEGGNIYAKDLTITGGTVSDGESASYGGNLYITGTSTISGGTVENGLSTSTTRSGGNICVTGGELTVSGDALITGGEGNEGGNISMRQGGIVNVTGGIIEKGLARNHGGNIAAFGSLNISGGVIREGSASVRGGNISGYANTCNINITGGQILDGIVTGKPDTNTYGANIAIISDDDNVPIYLTITGGTVSGIGEGSVDGLYSVHVLSGGMEIVTTVGGTAQIDSLRLGTDRMLTVAEGGFSGDAYVCVSRFEIAGLFAPGAAQYANYFTALDQGVSVVAEGDDLLLVSENPYWAFTSDNKAIAPAATIADALAMENVGFIRLIQDYATTEAIDGDVYLDLYGHDLSGLTINGNLYVIDYKGNSYEEGVLGSLTYTLGQNGTVNGGKAVYSDADRAHFSVANSYVMLANEDGSYSFHRVSVSITHVSLKADADALGFKATVTGDAQVLAAITGFGFNMGVEGGNMKAYKMEGNPADGVFTLRLKNIMAAGGGEMTIIGQPVIFFGEDAVTGGTTNTSMKQTIEAVETAVEKSAEAYTEAQMTTVQALIAQYESSMEGWNIDAIKAWTAPSTEETPAA